MRRQQQQAALCHPQHGDSRAFNQVSWVNEHEEKGLPYDISVVERDGGVSFGAGQPLQPPTAHRCYIEVKSTTSLAKPLFEMSMAELEFAMQHGARHSLYRVLGACSPAVRVLRLDDVARSIASGGLVLFAGAAGAVM